MADLAIEWTNRESKGCIDIFPGETFYMDGWVGELVHPVIDGADVSTAKCWVSVDGTTASLNYETFREYNQQRDMCLGIIRMTFSSNKRTKIAKIEWKDIGKKTFIEGLARSVKSPLGQRGGYQKTEPSKKTAERDVVERPGQEKFKKSMMVVYNGTCCISGCTVPKALEAAHIDPYHGVQSNHPQNGLLLRRDLHALFDAGLIGINPETMVVKVARNVLPNYREFNKQRLSKPTYGGVDYAPSKEALRRRWKAFVKNQK